MLFLSFFNELGFLMSSSPDPTWKGYLPWKGDFSYLSE